MFIVFLINKKLIKKAKGIKYSLLKTITFNEYYQFLFHNSVKTQINIQLSRINIKSVNQKKFLLVLIMNKYPTKGVLREDDTDWIIVNIVRPIMKRPTIAPAAVIPPPSPPNSPGINIG